MPYQRLDIQQDSLIGLEETGEEKVSKKSGADQRSRAKPLEIAPEISTVTYKLDNCLS